MLCGSTCTFYSLSLHLERGSSRELRTLAGNSAESLQNPTFIPLPDIPEKVLTIENPSVRMFLRTLHEEIKLLQPVVVVNRRNLTTVAVL